ncbi:MAG: 3-hydroxyacyl-CoA dehydrogenase, partial [Hyphomicrobiales bacterium]
MAETETTIGVVGAGAMGQGIAQVALQGGLSVVVHDAKADAAQAGVTQVFRHLDRSVEKGRLTADAVEAMRGRITVADSLQGLAECDVVIEAVFEDLALKQEIFGALEGIVGEDSILASNTSSLLIAAIARPCRRRERIAGLHFFNPVPLMSLVEVVRGPETAEETVRKLIELAIAMDRTPVVARDAPGFIVNHGGRAYTTEAMRILHEQVATPAQIDAVMRDCCGFRMGPCELMDLTGVDVNFPVTQSIYHGFSDDPRLKTAFPHLALHEAGRLGRKTGLGHYAYDESGRMVSPPSPDHVTEAEPAERLVLAEADSDLRDFASDLGVEIVIRDDGESPILAVPLGEDCTSFAVRTGNDFRRLVSLDLSGDASRRVTLMTAPGADPACRDAVAALVARSGRAATVIRDSPGFIAQRLRAMIANLGCEMAQIGIAEPTEIDVAMRLGLNYPSGPLELAEEMGLATVMAILQSLQAVTGE